MGEHMPLKNKAQLITYPDSLGGSLASLDELLNSYFVDIFSGGVHILPPYPSSGDRGFAPLSYFEIDPRFGTWADIRRIGSQFDVVLDLMVNHISRQSPFFLDFQEKGRRSPYADMFITLDKIWPGGVVPQDHLARIFLRRPEHPFADVTIQETGEIERVWATFGTRDWSEQIDLDVNSPATIKLFRQILLHMSRNGVQVLRLDAVAYTIKKAGTSCFFIEPEIYTFLDWFTEEAAAHGIELLPEVHAHPSIQFRLAEHGYWVYNFILPLLVLHALESRSSLKLRQHLSTCPVRQFTMLDCHDGIPVLPDIEGVLEAPEAEQLVEICLQRGANLSRIYSPAYKKPIGFAVHQINITYFSALDGDEDAYTAARAIQLFSPGIPQVYYVGLLAGENDQDGVEKSGEKRAINRYNFSIPEVERALKKPVVQRLLKLIRFRNQYPAFNGRFRVLDTSEELLVLTWQDDPHECLLKVDLVARQSVITYRDEQGRIQYFKL
jgi:sucrose 6(F)-phosphate phosphorylase